MTVSFPSAAVLGLLLACNRPAARAQETLSRADKAIFDELQVAPPADKELRDRLAALRPALPPSEIPAIPGRILSQLEHYETSLDLITGDTVTRARKALGGQLIRLSGAAQEPLKTTLIVTAKTIEGHDPLTEPALYTKEAEDAFTGEWIYQSKSVRESRHYLADGKIKTPWSLGKWRWLNQSRQVVVTEYALHSYVDLMVIITAPDKPPRIEAFSAQDGHWSLTRGKPESNTPPLPPEARRVIEATRAQESKTRLAALNQKRGKRERVAAYLVEKAKAAGSEAARLLLARAETLRSGGTTKPAAEPEAAADAKKNRPHDASAFTGKVIVDEKQRPWEFMPDGTVKFNSVPWGSWEWAWDRDDYAIVICSGGPGRADNPMIVRRSGSKPGTFYFVGMEGKFGAKVRE
jgi:hypothetical protein